MTHDQIAANLASLGIDLREPGFYDHPNFVAQERRRPEFLEEYARFVATRPMTPDYIEQVRRDVPVIAQTVHQELVADGRLGACIDIGMILSRILEREGIWNVQVKGSLTIEFQRARLPTQYFWSVDKSTIPFAAAHSWLVVPPYSVVDIALKQQPYRRGRNHVPPMVFTESREHAPFQVERIVAPEIRALARHLIGPRASADDVGKRFAPAWLRLRGVLPPILVDQEGAQLIYDAVAIGAPDVAFEQMDKWPVNGRLGPQLYRELIVPALRAARGEGAT